MLTPRENRSTSLIASYGTRLEQTLAVRRAETAARTARIEAELAIKSRSEFLQNMNHELRTPLNAIIGFTTMLKDESAYNLDAEKRAEYATYVLQSADLLLGHINTILEIAALDGGSIEVHQNNVSLQAILTEAADRAGVASTTAGVTIDVIPQEEAQIAWADPERLSQALDHLLRIAVKHSSSGARIIARATEDANGWREIAIRDHGKGLSEEEIQLSLSAFDEAQLGLDRSFDGLSVGLAIAKTFVEMQGGRFSIKSRPGNGTLVRLAFPPERSLEEPADADGARLLMTG